LHAPASGFELVGIARVDVDVYTMVDVNTVVLVIVVTVTVAVGLSPVLLVVITVVGLTVVYEVTITVGLVDDDWVVGGCVGGLVDVGLVDVDTGGTSLGGGRSLPPSPGRHVDVFIMVVSHFVEQSPAVGQGTLEVIVGVYGHAGSFPGIYVSALDFLALKILMVLIRTLDVKNALQETSGQF